MTVDLTDSHHHLWLIDESNLNWLSDSMRQAGGAPIADFDVARMEETFASVGTKRSVLVEAWHEEADQLYWMEQAERSGTIAAVIGWAPLDGQEVDRYLDRFSRFEKFRGLRLNSQDEPDPDFLQRPDIRAGIARLAARDGLIMDLLIKLGDLKDVPELCRSFPDQNFVLDHLAKPQTSLPGYFEPWAELMAPLVDIPNIEFKLSGMLTEAGPNPTPQLLEPPIRYMFDNFGSGRLLWGSDWPVSLFADSYRANFEMMSEAIGPLTESEQTAVFGGNAAQAYRLP